jgi:hypothetical protein
VGAQNAQIAMVNGRVDLRAGMAHLLMRPSLFPVDDVLHPVDFPVKRGSRSIVITNLIHRI